jgi:hypothetical protein
MLTALNCGKPDRLPVTTHHPMQYFLDNVLDGINNDKFFDRFGLDGNTYPVKLKPDESKGQYIFESVVGTIVASDNWRPTVEKVEADDYPTWRCSIATPKGTLTMLMKSNEYTMWAGEFMVKEKKDIELIAEFAPDHICDTDFVNAEAERFGERGFTRGHIKEFDFWGQPGTWQDAACMFGIEKLIMATYDDPQWVNEFLTILCERKKKYAASLKDARYDIIELGGGDASSTVISPKLFEEFVAPYDSQIIETAHEADIKIVYHTCGGMMPILNNIKAMNPDAMETFTPVGMGADVELGKARKILGDDICMIGGFDQLHYFKDCSPQETRNEVRRCFEEAGSNGAFILCPSDHFFDADIELFEAFTDEARKCVY